MAGKKRRYQAARTEVEVLGRSALYSNCSFDGEIVDIRLGHAKKPVVVPAIVVAGKAQSADSMSFAVELIAEVSARNQALRWILIAIGANGGPMVPGDIHVGE